MSEKINNIDNMSKSTIEIWEGIWSYNSHNNHHLIQKLIKSKRCQSIAWHDKENLKGAVVSASGPSLDLFNFEALAQNRDNLTVFASLSNAAVWLAHGITPDYVGCVDAALRLADYQMPPGMEDDLKQTTLLCPPTISPSIIRRWKGPIRIVMPMQPGLGLIKYIEFGYSEILEHENLRDRMISQQFPISLMNAGCVINFLIMCANYLGHGMIGVTGFDLGFPHGRQGCTRYTKKKDKWVVSLKQEKINTPLVLLLSDNGLQTTEEQLAYKMNFYVTWAATQSRVYRIVQDGDEDPDDPMSILGNTVPTIECSDAIMHSKEAFKDYYGCALASDLFGSPETQAKWARLHAYKMGLPVAEEDKKDEYFAEFIKSESPPVSAAPNVVKCSIPPTTTLPSAQIIDIDPEIAARMLK